MSQYNHYIILFLFFLFGNINAQQQFQKKYESTNSSRAYSVSMTNDGGFILAGSYDVSGLLSAEYYVVKLDATGDTMWAHTYGPTVDTSISSNRDGAGNEAYNVIQTFDSGYMVVGEAHAFGSGSSDIFVLKLTPQGDTVWTKTYGGINSDYSYKVIQLADSGYILSGYTESYGLGVRDIYVLRLDEMGDTLWAKSYGGNGIDGSNDMIQTNDGGFAIVGNTFSFGEGVSDVYVIKISENGTLKWATAYGGALNDFGNAISETSDSGFVISGSTESFGSGQRDVYVLKIDSIGNLIWSNAIGGIENESGKAIQVLPNNEIVVFGNTRSFGNGFEDFYLIKLDALGDTIMTKTYGGTSTEFGESIKQTSDKGFIMAGFTNSFNTWNYDIYLVKTDSLGISGCNESTTSTIVISPLTIKTVTNASTSLGSGITYPILKIGNTLTKPINVCNINSVNDIAILNQLIIFPNPTNNVISILDINNVIGNEINITIIDLQGKALEKIILNKNEEQIDISHINNGVYIAKIETSIGTVLKKIVKY
ncbi:T9SS type A sorting domain-containing protein [bacterium]|nr:T9SS type A sorting domain-containing protein [bacterium]MDB4089160.1 T9SS type A sorting domain-containing protein [Flavobacteriales bacterium]